MVAKSLHPAPGSVSSSSTGLPAHRSLDPSHIPGLNYTRDRTTGQAVYDSVTAAADPNEPDTASRLASSDPPTAPSRQRRRRHRTRSHSDIDSESGPEQIPVPPIPDLRYEQGVLASLKPFLHRVPDSSAGPLTSSAGHETEKHEREVHAAEKVTLAARNLTAEGTTAAATESDIFLGPLRVEWSRVAYVIVRDQVRLREAQWS